MRLVRLGLVSHEYGTSPSLCASPSSLLHPVSTHGTSHELLARRIVVSSNMPIFRRHLGHKQALSLTDIYAEYLYARFLYDLQVRRLAENSPAFTPTSPPLALPPSPPPGLNVFVCVELDFMAQRLAEAYLN